MSADIQTSIDEAAITKVINYYHHIVDGPEIVKLGRVFANDAVMDLQEFGGQRVVGVQSIIDVSNDPINAQVVAHLATNLIFEIDGDEATCVSRCIAMLEDGKVGVSVHSDRLRRTEVGWRISERIITMPPNLKLAIGKGID